MCVITCHCAIYSVIYFSHLSYIADNFKKNPNLEQFKTNNRN